MGRNKVEIEKAKSKSRKSCHQKKKTHICPKDKSIPEYLKAKLRAKDEGRCLITTQVDPLTIKACHILACDSQQIIQYQKMWGLKKLNTNTPANLVSLRADYRNLYEGGTWTFVPDIDVLRSI